MPSISGFFSSIEASVSLWQVALVALLLLILSIILICVLAGRNRKCEEMAEEKERAGYEADRIEHEHRAALSESEDALIATQTACEEELTKKDREIAALRERAADLQKFHDVYSGIPSAQSEAARIIREAKDHAYIVSNRTEMEYAEIIEHATQEAEAMNALARERLNRSHETLKKALARAGEIIEEAHAQAAKMIAVMPPEKVHLIEAPVEDALSEPEERETPDAEPACSVANDGNRDEN